MEQTTHELSTNEPDALTTRKARPLRRLRRNRRRQLQGMTLIEIMIVMVIMALVAGGAAFAIVPQMKKAKVKQTIGDAKAISAASELYLSEHDDCPTVSKLVESKILDKKKQTKDSWGNEFSIECDEDGATVKSSGPDGQMGTEDDIE